MLARRKREDIILLYVFVVAFWPQVKLFLNYGISRPVKKPKLIQNFKVKVDAVTQILSEVDQAALTRTGGSLLNACKNGG